MITKEQAYKKIQELVTRFEEQYSSYKKSEYNETLTRRDFIDPFFKALGWDIDNEQGYAEAYREVIHEDKIKVGKATKAPDYSFRIGGGKRLFFVEAKKPSVDVKGEVAPAYQVRRYGWSAKLPISIITDFEEFAVYDCTKKPNPTDKASVSRTNYLTFREYLTQFDFLWDTFSKEKVLKGSFDKYVQSTANKKGTATVDKEFLQSLDNWRTLLAENIAKSNKELDEDEINFVVQQTIDRLIFLRIAEDRGVEPYGNMQSAITPSLKGEGAGGEVYKNLFGIFRQADDKYNSGLFDFKKDALSKDLIIENKIIKTIINQLYYPESPYEFSVLSVEILGSAYEQFLGKQITLSKSGKAIIEEKPEVRKAGGVYYTPQYIVDYIVANTVGKLCENKTPKQVTELTICDPACGSGSFLLGAYQYLLDWHKNYYSENGRLRQAQSDKRKGKDSPLTPDGNLTTAEKKRILLNNIYGVDIDVNAVEVTKLSLLLKCMEGETSASIAHQMSMFNERVLPTLDNNIKSGNSLIDLDYYSTQLDFGEEKKIKPFSWQKAFADVFKKNGFDVVIGNPPYVRSQNLDESIKGYLVNKYSTSASYQPDLFAYFIDKGMKLLCNKGQLGFIIPNGILTNNYYAKSRLNILNSVSVKIIVDLKDKVFEGASVDTSIFILERELNEKSRNNNEILIGEYPSKITLKVETPTTNVKQVEFLEIKDYIFNTKSNASDVEFLKKIKHDKVRLGDLLEIKNGMKVRKEFVSNKKENSNNKKFILGASVKPYDIEYKNKWVCYDKKLEQEYTNQAFRDEKIFTSKSKLLVRQVMGKDKIFASIDNNQFYADQSIYILLPKKNSIDLIPLLAILNSKLMYYYFSRTFADGKETFPKIKGIQLAEFPIVANINSKELSNYVEQILTLKEDLKKASLETKKEQIQNRISYCEDRVNEIVYELYGLSEEEIKIIEGK